MNNLIITAAHALPIYQTMYNSGGEVRGVRIKRSTYSIYYHRTARGVRELKESGLDRFIFKSQGRRILDLGCGDGKLVKELRKFGFDIHGLDVFLSDGQENDPNFVPGDAFRTPFASQTFDMILSTWSVFSYEPLAQIHALLTEAKRMLRTGGSIFITPVQEPARVQAIQFAGERLKMKVTMDPATGLIRCQRPEEP